MANKNKNKKNRNKNSSKAKQTQAEEPQPLPTAKVLPSASQAGGEPAEQIPVLHSMATPANGIEPDGILVLSDEKIDATSKLATRYPRMTISA